jgi:hypothetical protein
MGKNDIDVNLDEVIYQYDIGHATLECVYDYCETDLDFYNFLSERMEEEEVKETMRDVTGADDAYYNALAQAGMK